jgi:hypothetical protein
LEAGIMFARTHNLTDLLNMALVAEPTWSTLATPLNQLSGYAVDVRYPGKSASKTDAQAALRACREVRRVIRMGLGLPP